MYKTRFFGRLAAFGASAAITLSIAMAAAHYALPGDDGGQVLVKADATALAQ